LRLWIAVESNESDNEKGKTKVTAKTHIPAEMVVTPDDIPGIARMIRTQAHKIERIKQILSGQAENRFDHERLAEVLQKKLRERKTM
jgi:hypothetical protein